MNTRVAANIIENFHFMAQVPFSSVFYILKNRKGL